jgi:hypothetical protein
LLAAAKKKQKCESAAILIGILLSKKRIESKCRRLGGNLGGETLGQPVMKGGEISGGGYRSVEGVCRLGNVSS